MNRCTIRRLLSAALLFALGSLAGAGMALAQATAVEQRAMPAARGADVLDEIRSGPEARVTDAILAGAETRWLRRRALASAGDAGGAALAGDDLLDFVTQHGVGRVPSIAQAALLEGRRHAARGRTTFAVESYRLAHALDPSLAAAWWSEARLEWERGERRRAARLWWQGLEASANRLLAALLFGAHAGRFFLLTCVLTGAGVILALLFLHGPRLAAGIGARLSPRWHPAWRVAFGWAVVLAPLASVVLGAWAFVAWAVVLVPALGRRERVLVWGWLALLVVVSPLSRGLATFEQRVHDDAMEVAVAAAEGRPEPGLVADLAAIAREHRGEAVWPVLIARLCGRQYPDRAVQLLRDAAAIDPGNARIRVMLGNIFYRMGKHQAAGVLYREAAALDPRSALPRLNLSRVRLAAFEFGDADELASEARRVDPEGYRALIAALDDDEVGDPGLPAEEIAAAGLRSFVWPHVRAELTALRAAPLAALAALLAALALGRAAFRIGHQRCPTCGAIFGNPGIEGEPWERCSACRQLFAGLDGLAPAAREVQSKRVTRFIRRRTIGRAFAQLLWPGLAVIHDGRPLLGVVLAFVSAAFALGTIQALLDPMPSTLLPGWPHWFVPAAGWALVWLAGQLPGLRPRVAGSEWSL